MKLLKAIAVCLMLGTVVACDQIDTGNVGVSKRWGQISPDALEADVYFRPFSTIYEVSTKNNSFDLENMQPKAKDNVTLDEFDISVYYNITGSAVPKIMSQYAGDATWSADAGAYIIGQTLVERTAKEAAYKAVAQYNAVALNANRDAISEFIKSSAQSELDKTIGHDTFFITDVLVRNIKTDARLEEATKNSAEVEFTRTKKQQELEVAKIEAQKQAIEAQGKADANRILSESLTPQLIELKRIEAMVGFAGTGTHTVLMNGGMSITPVMPIEK